MLLHRSVLGCRSCLTINTAKWRYFEEFCRQTSFNNKCIKSFHCLSAFEFRFADTKWNKYNRLNMDAGLAAIILGGFVLFLIFIVFIDIYAGYSRKRHRRNWAVSLVNFLNKTKEYECSCNSHTNVSLGFNWAILIMLPFYIIVYGLFINSYFSYETSDEEVLSYVYVILLLLCIDSWNFYRKRKKLIQYGHKKSCANKCAFIANFYDLPRIETFSITKKRI